MQHRFAISLLMCLLLLSIVTPAAAGPRSVAAITYYVSTGGLDSNNGLSPAAPFASVSKVNSLALQPGDRVLFKCGDQWHADPLTITRSGSAGQPITFSSYPAGCSDKPVLSGSLPITGWVASGSANIYYADMGTGPNAGRFPNGLNQLFRNRTRLTLGRWPNIDDPAYDNGYATIESQPGARQVTDNQLPSANWAGAVAHIRGMRWYILNRQVTANTGQTLTVGADLDCWDGCAGWGYFLNNNLAALDQEGEWFYSASAQRLYLYSTSGIPAQIEGSVILKTGDQAGRFWGGITLGQDLLGEGISYVTIENFSVQRWFRDGIAMPTNFAHYEPHDLSIQNNTIQDVDSTGLRLMTWVYDARDGRPDGWRGGYNLLVTGNTIERANRMGIDLQSRNSTFNNNTIRDIGMIQYLGASGLGCGYSDGGGSCTEDGDGIRVKVDQPADSGNTNNISDNRLERIAYNGVDIFGHNNGLARNVILQACFTKGDCGGVRTFGSGNISSTPVYSLAFTDNIILDTIGNTDGCKGEFKSLFGFGLYIDNYSRNIYITENTIIGSTMAGILIQNSTAEINGNTLYNNVTGSMSSGQIVVTGPPSYVTSLMDNVLYSLTNIAWTLEAADRSRLGKSVSNYFFNPYRPDHIAVEGTQTLSQWQAFSGQDANSVEAWFNLAPATPPNSHIFYNDSGQTKTISLGSSLYKDLDQKLVYGSLTLLPYRSKVLIVSGELPDLVLTMAGIGSTNTIPSAPVAYTLTVSNQGNAPAGGLVLTNLIPDAITAVSWQTSTVGVTARNGTRYVWDLPDLAPGAAATITVTGQYLDTLTPGVLIASLAEVSTSTPESATSNNQAMLLFGTLVKLYLPLVIR